MPKATLARPSGRPRVRAPVRAARCSISSAKSSFLKMSPPAGEDGESPRRAAYVKLCCHRLHALALCGQDAASVANFFEGKGQIRALRMTDSTPVIRAFGCGRRRKVAQSDRRRFLRTDFARVRMTKSLIFSARPPCHGRPCAVQLPKIAVCRPVRSAWPVPPAVPRIPQ